MNFPNILTVSRILLTVIFIYLIIQEDLMSRMIAAGVFTVASISDYLDGYFARKNNVITDFGKIMDPIADKFLILSAFFIFMKMGIIPLWMCIVIVVREILITGLRLLKIIGGKVLAAENLGKMKTVVQMIAVYFILVMIVFNDSAFIWSENKALIQFYTYTIFILMYAVVILTVVSGINFLWNNRRNLYAR